VSKKRLAYEQQQREALEKISNARATAAVESGNFAKKPLQPVASPPQSSSVRKPVGTPKKRPSHPETSLATPSPESKKQRVGVRKSPRGEQETSLATPSPAESKKQRVGVRKSPRGEQVNSSSPGTMLEILRSKSPSEWSKMLKGTVHDPKTINNLLIL
jgi:hypothetical protein